MHIAITRGRLLAAGALFLALIALILGILVPPRASDAGAARDGDGPRLLISEFGHVESTIWLVNPDDPARRRRFLRVEHAPGWELAGAPAPHGDGLAYLVLPPGHYDARTQATLRFTTGNGVRSLATGLDLKGGVAWSADGEALYVRRWRGGPSGREDVRARRGRSRWGRRAHAAGPQRRRGPLPPGPASERPRVRGRDRSAGE